MFEKIKMGIKNNSILFASLILALGLSLCGYFISKTTYNSTMAVNTAEAKGLSERKVNSDLAILNVNYSVKGKSKEEMNDLYNKAEENKKVIVDLLKANDFSDKNIETSIISYENREIRDERNILVDNDYFWNGVVTLKTIKVEKVEEIRAKLNKLILQGIDVEVERPKYYFTKLNEIKPEMLKEATKNARIAANEFAENAGMKVGGIQSALQGGFGVTDSGAEYGDTDKIEKDVRVITTIRFYLAK